LKLKRHENDKNDTKCYHEYVLKLIAKNKTNNLLYNDLYN